MNNIDPRDIDVTDPNEYFEFTAPTISPVKVKVYMLKKALENLKTGEIPQKDDFKLPGAYYYLPGAYYYMDTNGRYGGYGCKSYFFLSPEIVQYLSSDTNFVKKAIKENVTWWLPENVLSLFVF